MLKKGDRVKFTMDNQTVYGVVERGGYGKIKVMLDDRKHYVIGTSLNFQLSDHPFPEGYVSVEPLKKGDRVEFSLEGQTTYGVVGRGGTSKVTVIVDGAERCVSGAACLFRLSDHPLPQDEEHPLSSYSLKSYKEIPGHGDSRTFSATILHNGSPIATVSNGGYGGCNEYSPLISTGREDLAAFFQACTVSVKQFGYPDMIEPEDFWAEWYQQERPFGITFKSAVVRFKTSLDEAISLKDSED